MTRITFCVDEELKKRLESKARADRRSVSNVINICLVEYLSKLDRHSIGQDRAFTLSVLLVEDSDMDAELVIRALRKAGYTPRVEVVKTSAQMQEALRAGGWDVVFSDWELPGFSGLQALEIHRRAGSGIPFIIVSGRIGEEAAVEAIRAGADDFVPKDRLEHLKAVLDRVLGGAQGFNREPNAMAGPKRVLA
jgi:CheY-like chemotaxis protein